MGSKRGRFVKEDDEFRCGGRAWETSSDVHQEIWWAACSSERRSWLKTEICVGWMTWSKLVTLIWKHQFSSVQSLNHAWLFVTPWTAARQASLSITNSWSPPKPMCIESVMPSSVIPFSSCLQSFLTSGSFPMSQFFILDGQNIGVSASALVLPMNIPDWFPLGWSGWISL